MLQLVLLFHIACKWFNHLVWNNRAGSSLYLWSSELPNKAHWYRLFSLIYSYRALAVWRPKSINSGQCSYIISYRTQKIILGRKLLSETFTCLLYKKPFCPYCKSFCLLVPTEYSNACVHTQSCPTLCHPMDCSPSSSSVHGFFQAKITGAGYHFLLQGYCNEVSFSFFNTICIFTT